MQWNRTRSGQRDAQRVAQRHHAHREVLSRLRQFFGHSIERVDVRSATEQTLPEDEREHDPDRGHKEEYHFAQNDCDVDRLEHGHDPDLVDGDHIDRRPRNENADLVVDLQPTVLFGFREEDVLEIDQFEL